MKRLDKLSAGLSRKMCDSALCACVCLYRLTWSYILLGTPKMCARLNFSPISMLAFPGNLFPNNNIQFKIHLIDIFDESRTFNFSVALIYSSQPQFFSLHSGENSFWSRVFSNFKLNAFCEIFNFCTNRRKEEKKIERNIRFTRIVSVTYD